MTWKSRNMLLCALELGLVHPSAECHGPGRDNKLTKSCLGLLWHLEGGGGKLWGIYNKPLWFAQPSREKFWGGLGSSTVVRSAVCSWEETEHGRGMVCRGWEDNVVLFVVVWFLLFLVCISISEDCARESPFPSFSARPCYTLEVLDTCAVGPFPHRPSIAAVSLHLRKSLTLTK